MIIAAATFNQVPEIVELWRTCDLVRPWNDPVIDAETAIDAPMAMLIVAEEDAQVIGTTMVGYDGHRGWIYYVAVAPERRGRGIAREMIQVAEDWLADRGAPKVQLMVRGDTLDVADYYRRLGYEDSDCVVLGKRLG